MNFLLSIFLGIYLGSASAGELIARVGPFELRGYPPTYAIEASAVLDQSLLDLTLYMNGRNQSGEILDGYPGVEMTAEGQRPLIRMVLKDVNEAPLPLHKGIQVRAVPARFLALMKYNGSLADGNVAQHERQLRHFLEVRGIQPQGPLITMTYDPPSTIWLFRRNAVAFEVSGDLKPLQRMLSEDRAAW